MCEKDRDSGICGVCDVCVACVRVVCMCVTCVVCTQNREERPVKVGPTLAPSVLFPPLPAPIHPASRRQSTLPTPRARPLSPISSCHKGRNRGWNGWREQ